jgi:hypothetical protein
VEGATTTNRPVYLAANRGAIPPQMSTRFIYALRDWALDKERSTTPA